MSPSFSRRRFIGDLSTAGIGCYLGLPDIFAGSSGFPSSRQDEKLFDWSEWEKFRHKVQHPCLTVKAKDLAFARENITGYEWAREYLRSVEKRVERYLSLMTDEFIVSMIEETTPGDPLWTPCPACRDQNRPYHPHGLWSWTVEKPELLTCDICATVFPNNKYPEDIAVTTKWGKPQKITFCGGESFPVFGYKNGRPSFTANIRSRKVQWMADYCSTLAEAFLLTGNREYGSNAKNILLRFAEVYPNWLVHVGYGEYADMDPRTASAYITNLPAPEICAPPNEPDNALWTGFWSAGRATGVGLESDFIRKVVKAYDLTCAEMPNGITAIYTDEEKRKIEKDLLLESTILLVCDKHINNKSVSNRTAVALVGMCVGHPGLVRFGLEGFYKTINEWYLADGTSSETPFYGLMTLGGIWDMAQSARGYSDPSGYIDQQGKRIDALDLYHNSRYRVVLDSFFRGLQGDLYYPPYADSFRITTLHPAYVELMVANYPDRSDYLALLKEMCGDDLSVDSRTFGRGKYREDEEALDETTFTLPYDLTKPTGYPSFSFYYRKPGLEERPAPALQLPDWCPEALRIGHLRTGDNGRESLLLMSASHWGIHHELDSLNLYYWKMGYEVLSDLGYLWDHPLKKQNIRTLAHNTVLLDEQDQAKQERGGDINFFKTFKDVKAMQMSSKAYPEAKLYRRTSAIIDHGENGNYVIDFFRVNGGKKQDYVFHAADSECKVHDLDLHSGKDGTLYDFTNIRSASGEGTWRVTWKSAGKMSCAAWSAGHAGEQVFIADGWGQRDWKNSDAGATIPYVVRRCEGQGEKLFISVFEGYTGQEPFVRNVKIIDERGVVEVETVLGKDFIMSMAASGTFQERKGGQLINLAGQFAATSLQRGKTAWHYAVEDGL